MVKQLGPIIDGPDLATIVQLRADVAELQAKLSDGVKIPSVASVDADVSSIFFNTDVGIAALCWKNGIGQVKEIRLKDL